MDLNRLAHMGDLMGLIEHAPRELERRGVMLADALSGSASRALADHLLWIIQESTDEREPRLLAEFLRVCGVRELGRGHVLDLGRYRVEGTAGLWYVFGCALADPCVGRLEYCRQPRVWRGEWGWLAMRNSAVRWAPTLAEARALLRPMG